MEVKYFQILPILNVQKLVFNTLKINNKTTIIGISG